MHIRWPILGLPLNQLYPVHNKIQNTQEHTLNKTDLKNLGGKICPTRLNNYFSFCAYFHTQLIESYRKKISAHAQFSANCERYNAKAIMAVLSNPFPVERKLSKTKYDA